MRCISCDCILTPQESVRKFKDSGEYTETCSGCLQYIPVATTEGEAYKKDRKIDPDELYMETREDDYYDYEDDYISDDVEDWE